MRRGSIVQLIVIGVLAGAVASAVALIPDWLPSSASREAGRIDFVFWFVTGICIFVFSIVAAVTVYAVWKFRVKPDDDSDGPPIHGHTGLEILWTAVPTILVTAIAIVSAIVLAKDDAAGANPLRVNVYAQQFFWSFDYPGYGNKSSTVLRLPVNRSVVLTHAREGRDPLVLGARVQTEAGPRARGPSRRCTSRPNKVGTYPLICTELCGLGHALMRSRVVVMEPDAFEKWAEKKGP